MHSDRIDQPLDNWDPLHSVSAPEAYWSTSNVGERSIRPIRRACEKPVLQACRARVNFLVGIGDRLPGTTGAAVAEQVVGAMPDEFTSVHSHPAAVAAVALRFPYRRHDQPSGLPRKRRHREMVDRECRANRDHESGRSAPEGEISGKVWRGDNSALRKLLEGYKQMDDDADIVKVDGSTGVVDVLCRSTP